jgi:hypothetical protein
MNHIALCLHIATAPIDARSLFVARAGDIMPGPRE